MALVTPTSERVHISLFGRTNAGKSTLMNRLVGYDAAIVSPTAGTTTDPVQKAIEINGLGAAVIVDTPGLDDFTELGGERMARTAKVLDKTDIAVVLFTDEGGDAEKRIVEECRVREIPVIAVLNQVDVLSDGDIIARAIAERIEGKVYAVSALTGEGIDELRAAIVSLGAQ